MRNHRIIIGFTLMSENFIRLAGSNCQHCLLSHAVHATGAVQPHSACNRCSLATQCMQQVRFSHTVHATGAV